MWRRLAVLRLSGGVERITWNRHGRRPLLLVLDRVHHHIVAREDALLACAHVAAQPPVVVHVLVHFDAIIALEGEIARFGGGVAVECAGAGQDGLRWRLRSGRAGADGEGRRGRGGLGVGGRGWAGTGAIDGGGGGVDGGGSGGGCC